MKYVIIVILETMNTCAEVTSFTNTKLYIYHNKEKISQSKSLLSSEINAFTEVI